MFLSREFVGEKYRPCIDYLDSMHSQDLYYDYLHARRAVLAGRGKIRKCYISLGDYSLFYDMSLSINNVRCSQIYGPLFEDYHHAEKIDLEKSAEVESEKVEHYRRFAHEFFVGEPSYYRVAVTREAISEFYSIYEKEWWQERLYKNNLGV